MKCVQSYIYEISVRTESVLAVLRSHDTFGQRKEIKDTDALHHG